MSYAVESMLTTKDNPFNPFVQWDEWYQWDTQSGYHTSSFLARLIHSSYDTSDADQDYDIDSAIDEVLEYNITGNYCLIDEDGRKHEARDVQNS